MREPPESRGSFHSDFRQRRLIEDVFLAGYVCVGLGVIPYADVWSTHLLQGFWICAVHLVGVLSAAFLLILGIRLADRFGPYWLWGWRETVAVAFLCLYCAVGYLARPHGNLLKESAWAVCIVVQGLVLACVQFLEAWFHDRSAHQGPLEQRRLAYQTCWHLFAASWTGVAAVLIVAGVVIGYAGAADVQGQPGRRQDILSVVGYLAFTVVGVFLWFMRPAFQKSAGITRALADLASPQDGSTDMNAH